MLIIKGRPPSSVVALEAMLAAFCVDLEAMKRAIVKQ